MPKQKQTQTQAPSRKYSLNKEDLRRLAIGGCIALAGALLTYLQDVIPHVDFGDYTPFVVAANSFLVNALRKYVSGV